MPLPVTLPYRFIIDGITQNDAYQGGSLHHLEAGVGASFRKQGFCKTLVTES